MEREGSASKRPEASNMIETASWKKGTPANLGGEDLTPCSFDSGAAFAQIARTRNEGTCSCARAAEKDGLWIMRRLGLQWVKNTWVWDGGYQLMLFISHGR